MLKLEIKIDDNKVEQEGKYPVSSIYNAVDKVFMKYDFRKEILEDGAYCYYGNGMSKDYGIFPLKMYSIIIQKRKVLLKWQEKNHV